ncbi:hypothetical protein ID866_11548 [Astraeus odoratus]|nr:hypothetical protein ID866_11548 [Astraeus odoratus]
MPFTDVPGPTRAKALYSNGLTKRDVSVTMRYIAEANLYITSIYPSNLIQYDVIVDIGSSYTWVGANPEKQYTPTSQSQRTGEPHSILYAGGGMFLGEDYIDTITLGEHDDPHSLTVNSQSIGAATIASRMPNMIDGILGLGRSGAMDANGNPLPPTIVDNLYSQGAIRYAVLGIYFIPPSDDGGGNLMFGGINDAVITTGLKYVPITNTSPANKYWGIDASLMYGGSILLGPTFGYLDTGSNAIRIASDAFSEYQSLTGAILIKNKFLVIHQTQYNNLRPLSVVIGDQPYDLSPTAQIQPRFPSEPYIILIIRNIGRHSGSGLDFSLGHPFLYVWCFYLRPSEIFNFEIYLYTVNATMLY